MTTTARFPLLSVLLAAAMMLLSPGAAQAQTTTFTYQGLLKQAGTPFNGTAAISFRLYAAATGGASLVALPAANIAVSEGVFTAPVDFGATYFRDGVARYIEAVVVDGGTEVVLSPRQLTTPAPLALGIVDVPFTASPSFLVVDQTAADGSGVFAESGPNYQSFTANFTGKLNSVVFLARAFFGSPVMYANLRAGVGASGTILGSAAAGTESHTDVPIVLDFSNQTIYLVAGQQYSIEFVFGAFIEGATPIAGTSGIAEGSAFNYWFQVFMGGGLAVPEAVQATSAFTAVSATTAQSAQTAQGLSAMSNAALNDNELLLRGSGDRAHGIGWFGGTHTFRNTSFAPDGPMIFGFSGGGLGTSSANGATGTLALRWNGSGLVGIGTGPSTAGYRLELPNASGPAGQGRANAWVTYSSRELKQNIRTVDDAATLIDRLRGVRFEWREEDAGGGHAADIGFIAEEVAEVLPELVTRTSEGKVTGLDYGRIVPVAIEAIKEQSRTIGQQRADLDALKERIARLERVIEGGKR